MEQDFLKYLKPLFHTPDLPELERANSHPVLDCGPFFEDIPIFCSAYTVERMSLFIREQTPIPIRLPEQPRARIGGTLYAMSADQIKRLDKRYKNRVQFQRELIDAYIPCGDDELTQFPKKVWFYKGIPEFWREGILWCAAWDRFGNNSDFQLAPRTIDNNRLINGHYRICPRVEEFAPKQKEIVATQNVVDYVRRKNKEAVSWWRKMKTKLKVHE